MELPSGNKFQITILIPTAVSNRIQILTANSILE